jgi:predicted O-methyltransferase YrrM
MFCPDVLFHHFPYVRADQSEIVAKFNATSSQETVASSSKWLETVWPRLPLGSNLHMTAGAERCWPGIKVLPECPVAMPAFCQPLQDVEDARWRDMIAIEPAETTVHACPSEADAEKYPEFAALAEDVTLLRSRLKMTYLEALVLHREATKVPQDGAILEIGSGDGGSLAVMALASQAALWAVDPFVPYDEEARTLVRGVMEGNEARFWDTAGHYEYAGRVRHIKRNSDQAASLCPDSDFDLILVDGNHSELICLSDLQLFWPKVKPGGTMLIHDYTTRFPGVIRACQRWGIEYKVFAGTSMAYARKPA